MALMMKADVSRYKYNLLDKYNNVSVH